MASIRTRPKKDGSNSYTVTWRDPEQGLKSRTYTDQEKAQELKDFLDSNGNSFKLAAESKRVKDKRAPTVSDMVERHISLLTKPNPRTKRDYQRMLETHIRPHPFGSMAIDRVQVEDVLRWMGDLVVSQRANQPTGQRLSRKSRKNVHAVVSAAFETELRQEAPRVRRNPAKGIVEAKTYDSREPVYLSPEDLDLLADRVDPHYRMLISLLGKTGLRYSEATALRRRDVLIRMGRASVRVDRAWKRTPDEGLQIGEPKTPKARRTVVCSQSLSTDLIEHVKGLRPDDLVFTRPDGTPVFNHRFHKEVWQSLTETLVDEGWLDRKPWIHEIRHAHCTHLLQAGRPVHAVQARLGHEDPQTTLKVYARLASSDDIANADALD